MSYSQLTESGHPEDNRIRIPHGWMPVLYADDPDAEVQTLESSLPKPGTVVMCHFDDRHDIQLYVIRKDVHKTKDYNPERQELVYYEGLDHNGFPRFYYITDHASTLYNRPNYRVFKAVTEPMVAWHSIELPKAHF